MSDALTTDAAAFLKAGTPQSKEEERKQASKHRSKQAESLQMTAANKQADTQTNKQADTQTSRQASKHSNKQADDLVSQADPQVKEEGFLDSPLVTVTFRLPQKLLGELSTRAAMRKVKKVRPFTQQDMVRDALLAYLEVEER